MSDLEPIAGVSLEAYARLCGLMSGTQPEETERHAAIALENGVDGEAWEEAKTGWTRRMTDPAHAMQIQQVFVPIYQRTVAELNDDREPLSLEEYARIKAALIFEKDEQGESLPPETVLERFGYRITQWGAVESYWTSRVARDEHGRIEDHYDEERALRFKQLIQQHGNEYAGR